MDFELSQELKMIQSLVRDFVNDQLKPLERDLLGRAADLGDAHTYLPEETEQKLVKMVRDMGMWGIGVPEELGGAGLDTMANCLIEEELAQTVIPFDFGDVTPVLFDCNPDQRESYFLPVFNRQKHAYLALMEPGNETWFPAMETSAEKTNGHYVVSGTKVCLSRAKQDYFAIVFATTAGNEAKDRVTCFLVDKDTPGFSVKGGEERSGWQAQVRQPIILVFDHCRIAPENILGEEGKAFHLGRKWLPRRRIIRGAKCVGVARRLLEEAGIQAQSWQSFGQTISRRTSIEDALADVAMSTHACHLMVYEAAWKADKGEPIRHEAAMVKLFATRMIHNVADRVAHIYNGPPSIAGIPLEKLARRTLAASATDLALEVQRSIIARDVLKEVRV